MMSCKLYKNFSYCTSYNATGKIYLYIFITLFLFLPLSSEAKVTGVCSNCHTMHNSQGGSAVAYDFDGTSFSKTSTPKGNLLIYSCLGCHSATKSTTWKASVTGAPIVFNTVEPTFNAVKGLAAGNFYWVQTDDAKGHNVLASNPESTLTEAPGRWGGTCGTNSCHYNIHGTSSDSGFTGLNNRQGCTKCHMVDDNNGPRGFHHKDDTGLLIDSAAEGWYRFLAGHQSGSGHGVTGIEDDDWELETSTDHNEYLGFSSAKNSTYGLSDNTMTGYCSGCHGNFHIQDSTSSGASPWIRHPSDTVLPNTGEYSAYNTYDPLVPVARPDLSGYSGSTNTINPGTDMVMCLSCHRAHGSENFKILRWDYKGWPGNAGTNGCNVCHSTKD